jgi:hypothetical protein
MKGYEKPKLKLLRYYSDGGYQSATVGIEDLGVFFYFCS